MHVLCNIADDWTLKEENSKCGQNHSWVFCQNAPHRETRWICSWIQLDKKKHYFCNQLYQLWFRWISLLQEMCWICFDADLFSDRAHVLNIAERKASFQYNCRRINSQFVQITSLTLRRGSEQIKACHSFEAAACIVLCWSIVVSCLQFHCVGWSLQIVLVVDGTARQISCLHLSPSSSAAAGTHRALLLCKQLSLVC